MSRQQRRAAASKNKETPKHADDPGFILFGVLHNTLCDWNESNDLPLELKARALCQGVAAFVTAFIAETMNETQREAFLDLLRRQHDPSKRQ
jgi:hypothetical protein